MFETVITVVGNVTRDLVERTTMEGVKVVNFGVISTERRYVKDTAQWVDGERIYFQVTCWRKLAVGVLESLKKGDPVVVTGRVYQERYQVNGEERTQLRLDASAVGPNLAKCTARVNRRPTSESGEEAKPVRFELVEGERAAQTEDVLSAVAG
ncbi:hypothetical protein GCM10010174_35730 [Kutzneria viridogrisea]